MPKALPVLDITAPVCCAPVAAGPVDDEAALHVALRLKALADPVRVKLISLLLADPDTGRTGGELAAAVGLSESTVSHHLTQLRKSRIHRLRTPRYERAPSGPSRRSDRTVHRARPELLPLPLGSGPPALRATRDAPVGQTCFSNAFALRTSPTSDEPVGDGHATARHPYAKRHRARGPAAFGRGVDAP